MKDYALENIDIPIILAWSDYASAITTLLSLSFFVFITVQGLVPPEGVLASAPLSQFSSARAMRHLQAIAQEPHPTGSLAHRGVRDYISLEIAKLGLTPEMQKTAAVNNIIVILKGTDSGKAILLVGHYDTVPTSPGANDDGAAISSMLETLRVLKAGQSLRNDVIFLFTDGEEKGLLGAKAFAYQHPLISHVGVVLNFEARGNSGPSIMFETGDQNGWIIREFAKAVHHSVANSLTSDIYRLLPNDTDFTVFREQGFEGLNFAYIKGAAYYHTPLDNINNIDERSLQHHGDYAVSLTRHLGNVNLEHPMESNFVYFNALDHILLFYPFKWVIPIAAFTFLLFLTVMILGFRKKLLNLKEVGVGLIALPLGMIVTAIIVTIVSDIIDRVTGGSISANSYNEVSYMIGLVALITAISFALNLWFRRLIKTRNLTFAMMVWTLLLALVTSFLLPGGSYLFVWPLLFGLVALAITFAWKDSEYTSVSKSFLLSIFSLPAIVLFLPMI